MRSRYGYTGLIALVLLLATAPAVLAHSGDPRLTTAVDSVTPALPAGVVIQARAGIAAQIVASNDTAVPLEALGRSGRPFLRISAGGVLADLANPDFYETSNPNGSTEGVPKELTERTNPAPAKWVRVSSGSSWGWYDHRLHPSRYQVPSDARRKATLARFEVPFRYGAQGVVAAGSVTFVPLLGAFRVEDPEPLPGLAVSVLQGRLPGLLLQVEPGRAVTVRGRDGEPFLRFGAQGAQVNLASRTYVEDQLARGRDADPPASTPRWQGIDATSYSWLDDRLRFPSDTPPAEALRTSRPTVVGQWSIPVTVDGRAGQLSGRTRWVPAGQAGGAAEAPLVPAGRAWPRAVKLGLGWGLGFGLVALIVVLARRRQG